MSLELFAYKRHAVVSKYKGEDKYVIIPQEYKGVPVTEIMAGAFENNRKLEGVFVPKTLQIIESNAFADCWNFKFISGGLEESEITDIPGMPEDEWPDLDALDEEEIPTMSIIPASVKTIADGAFKGTMIGDVDCRTESLELGESAFEDCEHMHMLALFSCKHLTIGRRAFKNSSLVRLYAPGVRMELVPEEAFCECKSLRSIMMHICSVGPRAFYNCAELRILGNSGELQSIGAAAFEGCTSLEGIKLPKKRQQKPKEQPETDDGGTLKRPSEPVRRTTETVIQKKVSDEPEEDCGPELPWDFKKRQAPEEKPLFMLRVPSQKGNGKPLPGWLKGTVAFRHGEYFFDSVATTAPEKFSLRVLTNQQLYDMISLLSFLSERGTQVMVFGAQFLDTYYINDIRPVAGVRGRDIAPDLFSQMLERMKRPVPDAEVINTMPPPAIRGEDEMDMFLEACRDRIPAWAVRAYNKNKACAHRVVGRTAEEERKHAQRAMELLMNIDWVPYVVDVPPAEEVKRLLDEAFYGLEDVKTRILEVVAQIRRTKKLPKWGILLHGPAGTAKTSIVKFFAKILKMPLIEMDMSTLGDDPVTVSGSGRIYSNARPGMILDHMYQNRSSTAVLLANEVDTAAKKNDTCSAEILRSILDKTGFYENFLEEVVPTDNIFCIGTCNDLDKISKPLKDRFLVVDITGYTPSEKKIIFSDYVLPRAKRKANILDKQMTVDEEAVELLVSEYALESGARDLEQYAERLIGDYCRSADTDSDDWVPRTYTAEDLRTLLGPCRTITRRYASNPGQINAAFYYQGKAHFFMVEAAIVPGSGNFKALGPMSTVQEEYCEVAYWCARNTISSTACDFSKLDVAVFVPQLIPDGADNYIGMACYSAICSKLMNANLAVNDMCFIGGCDMNGSLYFDENDLTPLLKAMEARNVSTVFAPMGTNMLVDAKANTSCSVTIVEAPDAKTLFSLAVAKSKCVN